MALEDDVAFFQNVPTFAVLGKQALRILAIGAESRNLQSGAVLFYAGELADGGYVVQEGSLLLEPDAASHGTVFTVGPGTLLGELALLTDIVNPVTATAQEPTGGAAHFAQPVSQDAGRLSGRRQEIARHHGPAGGCLDAGHGHDDEGDGSGRKAAVIFSSHRARRAVRRLTPPWSPSPARGRRGAPRRDSPWRS